MQPSKPRARLYVDPPDPTPPATCGTRALAAGQRRRYPPTHASSTGSRSHSVGGRMEQVESLKDAPGRLHPATHPLPLRDCPAATSGFPVLHVAAFPRALC